MPPDQNRVLLVGGGPVGLVAAHILAAARIPFVLLEQRDTIVPLQGAGIVLFPHTQRVLHQLGLMERIRGISEQFGAARVVNSWGWHYATLATSAWTEENHGSGWLFLHRPELLQVLYDALPDNVKPCLLPGKRVEDVEVAEGSVTVRCSDGTTEKGSILIGADGVHSRMRSCMRNLALRDAPSGSEGRINDEKPFVTTYRCMYGNTSVDIPGLKTGMEWDLHSADIAMQLFPAEDRAWFLFYQKLPKQTREATTYDEDAKAQVAAQVADYYVTDTVRFKDVWAARKWCMLADLPEGTVQYRHWKRMVLVGDAASRQTPNLGQGWNCGVQDVVVLVNGLCKLSRTGKETTPSLAEIEGVFQEYQETQRPEFDSILGVAAGSTRGAAWATWSAWLNDRIIIPWFGGNKSSFRQNLGTAISRGRVLDFLPENWRPVGVIPWLHKSRYKGEES